MSPAPEAAEPTVTVLPGNLFVADSSIPDSTAISVASVSAGIWTKKPAYQTCCYRIAGYDLGLASRHRNSGLARLSVQWPKGLDLRILRT